MHTATHSTIDVHCPVCGYELRGTIESGRHACPECEWKFTEHDLRLLGPSNPHGQPRTLNPKEARLSGRWLIAIFIAAALLCVLATWLMVRSV